MPLFDDLRSVVASILATQAPDVCNVLRPALADDGRGGKTPTYNPVNPTPIACFYEPLAGRDMVIANAPTGVTTYRLTLPAGTDLKAKDRIQVLARTGEPARTFEVSYVSQVMGVVIEVMATFKE